MFDYTQKILNLLDAPTQIEALYQAMQLEKTRRNHFREWITPCLKAEFINGQIILHSPDERRHWRVLDLLSSILSVFTGIKKLGVVGKKVLVALTRNDYEPDLVFFSKEVADTFTEDQMLFPAPDFVVEILSKGTASLDKGIKKDDYAAHGVREYWIIDPIRQHISQYILLSPSDKKYAPPKVFRLDEDIESWVIKGFNIPVQALFDEATNLETLQILLQNKN